MQRRVTEQEKGKQNIYLVKLSLKLRICPDFKYAALLYMIIIYLFSLSESPPPPVMAAPTLSNSRGASPLPHSSTGIVFIMSTALST